MCGRALKVRPPAEVMTVYEISFQFPVDPPSGFQQRLDDISRFAVFESANTLCKVQIKDLHVGSAWGYTLSQRTAPVTPFNAWMTGLLHETLHTLMHKHQRRPDIS